MPSTQLTPGFQTAGTTRYATSSLPHADSVSIRHCAARYLWRSGSDERLLIKVFFMPQHRPSDTCQLRRQRHHHDIEMGAHPHGLRPGAEMARLGGKMWHSGTGAASQLLAQVTIPALADFEQLYLCGQ